MEGLGEEGRVLEALVAYKKADELQLAKSVKEAELVTITGGAGTQQQKLRVCEICSALLSVYDSDRRLGKRRKGWWAYGHG